MVLDLQLFITSFHQTQAPEYKFSRPWEGIIERLKRTYTETTSNRTRSKLLACMVDEDCPTCHGEKLNAAARAVTVGDIRLPEFNQASVHEAKTMLQSWHEKLDEKSKYIGHEIIKEVENRLFFLDDVGLDYLTLDRKANTLSGGESQRIRLATQIGSRLTGVMYVLDEPSIGLHQR